MRTTLLISLLSFAACSSDPPPPSVVRSRITSDLGNVLHETKAASDASTADLPGAAMWALASQTNTTAARLVRAARLVPQQPNLAPEPSSTFDPDAIIAWLDDNVFTDANCLGNGIYAVPPQLVCPATDSTCAARVVQAQLRIRVEEDNSALVFAIQLDANHDEPITFALSHDALAVSVDLDSATQAMIALAEVFGDQAPNARLSGELTASLHVLGGAHAKLALTFDRTIAIAIADQGGDLDGDGALRVTSAAAPVLAIELDGNAPMAALDLGLGETTLHLPGDSITTSSDVELGGATADATFQGDTLSLDHVSLGSKTTTVSKQGVQAVAIDLNPADGRELSATLASSGGLDTLAVMPRFDLEQVIDHAVLGDAPGVYDVTRVLLDGSLVGGGAAVEVASGSFSIATNPGQYGFTASAGQCVTATDVYDDATAASYVAYAVGACH